MTDDTHSDSLPPPPRIDVAVLDDRTAGARCDTGFLRVRRLLLENRYDDGTKSAPYAYDLVERDAIDAVAIVLFAGRGPDARICLRSALRPPMTFRHSYALPLPEEPGGGVLWEIPAGLVEAGEHGEAGLAACAARETLEEVGLDLPPSAFTTLGTSAGLSPGVIGEKIHFLVAEVDPTKCGRPTEDGSPVEERAEIHFVRLPDAMAALDDGLIGDLKTEVGIRRLRDHLARLGHLAQGPG
ncbi:MAG: NUDIX domain-containing protein [Deltaproteobacteria bacterium]|nr:NUDIX domain-containing protein [Deltaproteobacteria bacterium]